MATPSNDPGRRRWADLAARAAATPAPPIDVRQAVMASLPRRGSDPAPLPGWSERLLTPFGHWGIRSALAGCAAIAGVLAYEGYRQSENLSLLLSFAF